VPLAVDAGTLLFPISYICGDILTEVYGYRRSRRVIWAGFFCLAFSSLVLLPEPWQSVQLALVSETDAG